MCAERVSYRPSVPRRLSAHRARRTPVISSRLHTRRTTGDTQLKRAGARGDRIPLTVARAVPAASAIAIPVTRAGHAMEFAIYTLRLLRPRSATRVIPRMPVPFPSPEGKRGRLAGIRYLMMTWPGPGPTRRGQSDPRHDGEGRPNQKRKSGVGPPFRPCGELRTRAHPTVPQAR